MIQESFFLCLFFGKKKYLSPIVRDLSNMPVQESRIGNPESINVKKILLTQLSVRKRGDNSGCGRGRSILQQ